MYTSCQAQACLPRAGTASGLAGYVAPGVGRPCRPRWKTCPTARSGRQPAGVGQFGLGRGVADTLRLLRLQGPLLPELVRRLYDPQLEQIHNWSKWAEQTGIDGYYIDNMVRMTTLTVPVERHNYRLLSRLLPCVSKRSMEEATRPAVRPDVKRRID